VLEFCRFLKGDVALAPGNLQSRLQVRHIFDRQDIFRQLDRTVTEQLDNKRGGYWSRYLTLE